MAGLGGGDRERFRDWSKKVTEIMQRLRPETRAILRDIGTTDYDEWNRESHYATFEDSADSKAMYDTLNDEMWWLMSVKMAGRHRQW